MADLWWCGNCLETVHRRTAVYCRRCGAPLVQHYDPPSRADAPSGWKSVPALVRFGIWLIVIPPLLWFSSCAACTMLAALNHH